MKDEKTKVIAKLNDASRRAAGLLCRLMLTEGIRALQPGDQSRIIELVETFKAFTPNNDPYGEHDFGAFDYAWTKILWKIDYYNRDMTAGSEDPSDPAQTTRVLTIMLASEY